MPTINEARYPHHGHPPRSNGAAESMAVHDANVAINAWAKAWQVAKFLLSGALILIVWSISHLISSGYIVGVAKTTDLTAVETKQGLTNLELKDAINAHSKALETQGEALKTLIVQSNDTRTDLSEIKGFLHGLLQANPPAPIVAPPSARKKQAHPGSGWFNLR